MYGNFLDRIKAKRPNLSENELNALLEKVVNDCSEMSLSNPEAIKAMDAIGDEKFNKIMAGEEVEITEQDKVYWEIFKGIMAKNIDLYIEEKL